MIPAYVLEALIAWHSAALQCDPNNPSGPAYERAKLAWAELANRCWRWELEGRAARAQRTAKKAH